MPLSDKEKYRNRIEKNKKYSAYISRELASPFDDKLKKENKSFTNWLKEQMQKFLKNT